MRRAIFARLLPITLLLLCAGASASDPLDQHLRDQYLNKRFILRGFYNANSVHLNAAGLLIGAAASGDWTVNGLVQIDEIKFSRDRLKIHARRLHLGWFKDTGFGTVEDRAPLPGADLKDKELKIESELDPARPPADAASMAFSHAFLTGQDSFVDLIPDYWKQCVRAALTESNDKKYAGCRFSPDFLAIPGVSTQPNALPDSSASGVATQIHNPQQAAAVGVVGKSPGVSPPKLLSHHEPSFTKEARKAKYQGTLTLGLIVNQDGIPTDVHVLTPLGCGLDANAVHTVEEWRFKPAEKNGEAVRVEIAVEVDFHLY